MATVFKLRIIYIMLFMSCFSAYVSCNPILENAKKTVENVDEESKTQSSFNTESITKYMQNVISDMGWKDYLISAQTIINCIVLIYILAKCCKCCC